MQTQNTELPATEATLELVTENPLQLAAKTSGLDIKGAASIIDSFQPLFNQAEEWRKKVEAINITDVSQVREMKLARETRLALKEIRVNTEHARKKLKENCLREGKAIEGIANVIKFLIEP